MPFGQGYTGLESHLNMSRVTIFAKLTFLADHVDELVRRWREVAQRPRRFTVQTGSGFMYKTMLL